MVKIWIFFSFLLIIWLDCPQRLKMCPKIFLKNVFEFARSFASKRKKSADRKTFQKNWPEKSLFWGKNDVAKNFPYSPYIISHLQYPPPLEIFKKFSKFFFEFACSFAAKRQKRASRMRLQNNWPEKGCFWGQNDVQMTKIVHFFSVFGHLFSVLRYFDRCICTCCTPLDPPLLSGAPSLASR